MMRFCTGLARGFRREERGTASIEFVLSVPVLMLIFMAAFESGLLMTRSIMLEHSLDMTMRELRLGHYDAPSTDLLKEEICKRTVIFKNCEDNIMIELQRVSTANFALPTVPTVCVDRDEDIQPVVALQIGQQNDLMLVRACVVLDAIFPTSGIGLRLSSDSQGGYNLVAMSAFANEPS